MAATKEKSKGKTIDVSRAVSAAVTLMKVGFSEMKFQNMIDRYQLRNLKADFSADARLKRAEALKTKAMELDAKFKGAFNEDGTPVVRASNWQPLANYFNETLAHMKESDFSSERDEAIRRDIDKAKLAKVTPAQEAVIIDYHTNRAKANWDKVLTIKALLEQKGLLKKAPAKLPTAEELAAIAAGQQE